MGLVPMSELLQDARAGGYAVPSFCVWSVETMEAVLTAAEDLRAPVILMNGPVEFPLIRPRATAALARCLTESSTVPVALHLDHGASMQQVRECLDAGFTSVMLDYSTRPFAENAACLRDVVRMAHPLGVTVEGEVGVVGRVGADTREGGAASALTDPDQAAAFVVETGVDALAVAIGNAHGQYTRLPRLDFERLGAIRAAVPVPLVLHGGTGTPPDDLRRAISLGIAKVNVATELVTALRESLLGQWQAAENRWVPTAMAAAKPAVQEVAAKWLRLTGAAGRISLRNTARRDTRGGSPLRHGG